MSTQSSPLLIGGVVVLVNPSSDLSAVVEGTFGVDQTENMITPPDEPDDHDEGLPS
jgi:hypothetical protein